MNNIKFNVTFKTLIVYKDFFILFKNILDYHRSSVNYLKYLVFSLEFYYRDFCGLNCTHM